MGAALDYGNTHIGIVSQKSRCAPKRDNRSGLVSVLYPSPECLTLQPEGGGCGKVAQVSH